MTIPAAAIGSGRNATCSKPSTLWSNSATADLDAGAAPSVHTPAEEPTRDLDRLARCAPYHVEGLDTEGGADPADASAPVPAEPIDGLWRNRLLFDPEVSDSSPVVRGTWITASRVVSLIVDGWSWADILRTHPELTEADLRACLHYTIEQEDAPLVL